MKRLISAVLALVMLLSLLAGCGQTPEPQEATVLDAAPTLFYDITGIPHDQVVMTVGDIQIPAELYFYWVCYVCSSLEYNIMSEYSNYGMYGSCIDRETMTVDWTSSYANMPLMEYALAQAEDTIKYYMSIEELAAEQNVTLTTANQLDMENTFRQAVEEMGGGDAFINYLKMLGISRASFDRISAASYLYMNLLDLYFDNASRYDADILLTYEEGADLIGMTKMVTMLSGGGRTVRVQAESASGNDSIRCKEHYRYTKGGLEIAET